MHTIIMLEKSKNGKMDACKLQRTSLLGAVDLFPAGNDIRHDGVDQTEALDGPLEAVLTVCDLGLHVQKTLLDYADQGSGKSRAYVYSESNQVEFGKICGSK